MKAPYRIAAGLAVLVFLIGVVAVQKYAPSVDQVSNPSTASVEALLPASTTPATTPAASTTPTTAATTSPKAAVKVLPSPTINASAVEAGQVTASGVRLEKALVNIVCVSAVKSIPSISGTGVIIDSRGIILTAAHVAQLFLLEESLGPTKIQCLVRTGSPARRAYLAEPIYVSPSWINANPSTLTTKSPLGNGQADVALLGITDTATSTPLPSSYPFIPLSSEVPQPQEQVAISSYGAQYLDSTEINYSLYPILVFGTIQNRYTYTQNIVDLFSVQGSAASQEGSSGGGVSNAQGQLIGTITTSTIKGAIQDRSLNAVTTGHLRRTFTTDMGQDLDSYIQSQSVSSLISNFRSQSLQLAQVLLNHIGN